MHLTIAALCTLIAWLAPLAEYQNFLLLIGSVFASLFGVVLVDHFILRRRRAELAPVCAWRADTLLAWGSGAVLYHLLSHYSPEIGATLPAFLLAAGLQSLLGGLNRKRLAAIS